MGHHRRTLAVIALAWSFTWATAESRTPRRKLPDAVERVIGWLPDDTETLIVAQGSFSVSAFVPDPDPRTEQDVTFLEEAQLLPAQLLLGSRGGLLTEELKGLNVTLAVEGSRRFRPPARLGMMPYEGCQIVQFDTAYLSRSPDSLRIASRGWNHLSEGLTPEIERTAPSVLRDAPGVVAISASVSDLRSRRMFLFVLLAYLGHGVYI
jgi:hypothetical protein